MAVYDDESLAQWVSDAVSDLYYRCHPAFSVQLTHQAVRALQFIARHPRTSVAPVARHLGCAQNTASELLQRLAKKRLIHRHRSEVDERVVELTVTPSGRRTLQQHTGLDVHRLTEALQSMPEEDKVAFEHGLRMLSAHIERVLEEEENGYVSKGET